MRARSRSTQPYLTHGAEGFVIIALDQVKKVIRFTEIVMRGDKSLDLARQRALKRADQVAAKYKNFTTIISHFRLVKILNSAEKPKVKP